MVDPVPVRTEAGGVADAVDGIVQALGGHEEVLITVNHQPSGLDTGRGQVPRSRIRVIPPGYDPDLFAAAAADPLRTWAGRGSATSAGSPRRRTSAR